MKVVAMDTHNQRLVKAIEAILADEKFRPLLTDLELLDEISIIVSQRKLVLGLTDCNTGLTYTEDSHKDF